MMKTTASAPQFNVPVRILFVVCAVGVLLEKAPWSQHTPFQIVIGCVGSLFFLLLASNSMQYVWSRRLFTIVAFIYAALVFYQIGIHSSL